MVTNPQTDSAIRIYVLSAFFDAPKYSYIHLNNTRTGIDFCKVRMNTGGII